MGHVINRRAFVGSQVVAIRAQIKDLEKLSRRTPPKTLATEWARVEAAKVALRGLVYSLASYEQELALLRAGERVLDALRRAEP